MRMTATILIQAACVFAGFHIDAQEPAKDVLDALVMEVLDSRISVENAHARLRALPEPSSIQASPLAESEELKRLTAEFEKLVSGSRTFKSLDGKENIANTLITFEGDKYVVVSWLREDGEVELSAGERETRHLLRAVLSIGRMRFMYPAPRMFGSGEGNCTVAGWLEDNPGAKLESREVERSSFRPWMDGKIGQNDSAWIFHSVLDRSEIEQVRRLWTEIVTLAKKLAPEAEVKKP